MDQISSYRQKKRAAVILAGGEGSRPRALTRKIPGRNIPKQFYAFFGTETLVERTLRRVALGIEPRLTSVVVTRAHDRLYMSILAGMPPDNVVVQPQNRGTLRHGVLERRLMVPEGAQIQRQRRNSKMGLSR